MKYRFVGLVNPNWRPNVYEMMEKLGVPGHRWPDAGLEPRMVDGIKVWVTPVNRALPGERKSATHRVRCECPGCGLELSAGRLFQHKCVRKYNQRKRTRPLEQTLARMRRALLQYNNPVAYVVGDAIAKALVDMGAKHETH